MQGYRQKTHQIGINQGRDATGQQQARVVIEPGLPLPCQPVIEARHRNQHANGDHRPRHGITQADQAVQAAGQAVLCQPGAVGQQQGEQNADGCRRAGQYEAVARQGQEALAKLRIALGQCHLEQQAGRQDETEQQRQHAGQDRQAGGQALQARPGHRPVAAGGVVVARPAA